MDDNLRKLIENEQKGYKDQLNKTIAEELTPDGDLLPPWKKYPIIPRGSIGWRMGGGESYMWAWDEWAGRMSKPQLVEYFRKYLPIPIEWVDWVSNRFGDDKIFEEMFSGGGDFDGIHWLEQQGLASFSEFKAWYDEKQNEENTKDS
jgi:hypothetical protein